MGGGSRSAYLPGIRPFQEVRVSIDIDNTRRAYKAFTEQDLTTLMELIAPDCIWHVPGRGPLAGTYTGHDQILGYFGKLSELSGGTFGVQLLEVTQLPVSGMIIALVQTSATVEGKTTEVRMVQLGRTNDHNQMAEAWWFSEDQYAQDEAFGPAQIVLPRQEATPVKA